MTHPLRIAELGSVPKICGLVPRYTDIDVCYFDQNALLHKVRFQGFLARVFQHEADHLNGITFVDRVESTADLYSETEWARQYLN
ncbi:peptide deformylase [Colwelliaceae bacterium 6471]